MPRCEDYPCCGHGEGGCPNEDGSYNCAECGANMPKDWHSACCEKCHKRWEREDFWEDEGDFRYNNEDDE